MKNYAFTNSDKKALDILTIHKSSADYKKNEILYLINAAYYKHYASGELVKTFSL